mmetsp:Transcript_34217/g.63442  ORF Transcript_34217/g.63442 Transcript_34217/m.63442 type:complete len:169 (-) Transcript_34217:108-614(-)|eukprot:CAMPEP_0170177732 /NCGR_PEP_ID=MMETSP0040_2-20121228/10924_1 /TAXON_ID=641309 /ORGANISM="Lotharella oceanica, Strain CCMP622" /LENGTH=168 /DNA_ID=CAMNT_0010420497 /DNA_START=42 /DNA_END=548 /DNA_ORIENTATION=+
MSGFKKGVDFSSASLDGKKLKIGIVVARWNAKVTDALADGCIKSLKEAKVDMKNVTLVRVAGSFELPFGAKMLIEKNKVDAVICIGTLIKGETMHFEYICESVSRAIMNLGISSGIPVIFGVLTCLSDEQALARAGLTKMGHNHGLDWGKTAVEMANMKNATSFKTLE